MESKQNIQKKMENCMTTTEARQVGKRIMNILKGIEMDVTIVWNRYVIVRYQGFLEADVLRPIIQPVCGGLTLVLMRNASLSDACHAAGCIIAALSGKRLDPIEL